VELLRREKMEEERWQCKPQEKKDSPLLGPNRSVQYDDDCKNLLNFSKTVLTIAGL